MSGRRQVFLAAFFLLGLSFSAFRPGNASFHLQTDPEVGQLSTPERIELARAQGLLSQETAYLYLAYALASPDRLPQEYHSPIPWDGTPYLLQLQHTPTESINSTAALITVQELLSSICSYSDTNLPYNQSSDHFYIEYDSIGGNLGVDDYIHSLEVAWLTQVDQFEWAAPPVFTANPAPGNLYPVHIARLQAGLYGFVSSSGDNAGYVGDNLNTTWNEGDAYASCMVLNRDYTYFPGTPRTALEATVAHEFNHSIQYGLGALNGFNLPDAVFYEGAATWMEDEVFDAANDNYNYLWPFFSSCMGNYNYSPYPYWITFRGMLEVFGTGVRGGSEDVMQSFWELTSQNLAGNLNAMNRALEQKGTTLADAYHNYAIAIKFNRLCQGGYEQPYCLKEGPGYVTAAGPTIIHGAVDSVGGNYSGAVQDNFALNWVGLPENAGSYDITLRNISNGGALRGSVVCDTGSSLRVQPFDTIVNSGNAATQAGFNSSGCTSVVLVITNQSMTAENPSTCISRSYQILTTRRIAPTPIPVSIFYFPFGPH